MTIKDKIKNGPSESLNDWLAVGFRTIVIAAILGAAGWAWSLQGQMSTLATKNDLRDVEIRLTRIESSRNTVADGAERDRRMNQHLVDQSALDTLQSVSIEDIDRDIEELKQIVREAVNQMRRYHGGSQ